MLRPARLDVSGLLQRVPEVLRQRARGKRLVAARSVISYGAAREMGHNGAEVARALNMSRSGVSIATGRAEEILRNNQSLRNGVNSLTM